MPKRILHVVDVMNRAGTESLLMSLYRNIDRSLIEFDFIVHSEKRCDFEDEIKELGGRIYRFNRIEKSNYLIYRKQWTKFFHIHKDEYKIIHGHMGSTAAIYLAIAKKNGLITIAHSHATKNPYFSFRNVVFQLLSYPTRFIANYFFACSLQAGIDRYGKRIVNSKNFCVLNNGIEIKKYLYNPNMSLFMKRKYNLKNNITIGVVGRLAEEKNPFFICDIFHEITKICPDVNLIWCGKGNCYERIKNYLDVLGITDKVLLLGSVSNIHEIMQCFDVFVFPSKYEGLGIVLIEAQTASIPCFISDSLPHEVDVTNLIHRISLNKTAKFWAECIFENLGNNKKKDRLLEIKNSGYDIATNAELLQDFYVKLFKEGGI